MTTITIPTDRQFFTVEEALELVAEASTRPLTVVDVFVEVATDDEGREYHPAGGNVAVEPPRTSDRGLIALYLVTEAFPAACKKLGILPLDPITRIAGAYVGGVEQNGEYLITADDLTRYAASHGVKVVTARIEPLPAQRMGGAEPTEQPAGADAAPLSRQRHQENEMLRVLADFGYDPKRLSRPPAGAAGSKSEARARLPEMSNKVFDKAWERLRSSGDIADAK